MTEVADLYVTLRTVGAKFKEGMAEAGASAESADSKIATVGRTVAKMALATGAGAVIVAGAALRMSTEFDRLMQQLHTLAHVPESSLASLSKGVLAVAGDVGTSPNSLAEALYHIESTFASVGIKGGTALNILRTAAEGAKIGGADLVDVTNALDAAVVSGIGGVKNINQAMGALMATVGAGDMTMQNLATALGSGILAIAKQFGVKLTDVGAALATFGDNNIRGARAATDLKMVIMDLTKQAGPGVAALQKIGIKAGELGRDMETGGLNKAILDLHAHLQKAGITGDHVGAVLEDAFTKKSAAPLAILMGELGQFESKYPELKKGANEFGDAWKRTAALISTKAADAKANVEVAFIGLGHMLAPIATDILDMFNGAFSWAKTHQAEVKKLGGYIKTFLVGALIIAAGVLAGMAAEAVIAAAPFILLAVAVGLIAKKLISLYEHNAKFRAFVQEIVAGLKKDIPKAVVFFKQAFEDAKKVVGAVIEAIVGFYEKHKVAIGKMVTDVKHIMEQVWKVFEAAFDTVRAIVTTAVKIIEDLWDRFGSRLWGHIVDIWHGIVQTIEGAVRIIKGIFELITSILTGKWSKAWEAIKEIVSGVWDAISGIVKTGIHLVSTLIDAAMATISAAWDFVWHSIETAAKAAWVHIKAVFAPVVNWFKSLIAGILRVWNDVTAFWQSIPGRIRGYLSNATKWLVHIGEDIVTGLWNGIVSVTSWVMSQLAQMPINIWHVFDGLYNDMLTIGENILTGIWNGISSLTSWLWGKIKAIPQGLWNILDGVYNDMLTVGHDIVVGIWNGISAVASWLWRTIEGWLDSLWNGIKAFFGISSPSKLMHETIGKPIAQGIASGILANKHQVMNAMQQVANEASNTRFNLGKFGTSPLANGLTAGAVSSGASGAFGSVGGGNTGNVTYVDVHIQGAITDLTALYTAVQQAVQQHGGRNTNTGLVFVR